ncbi:MAG: signal peptidase I [Steroidobacteraceae bacterium]
MKKKRRVIVACLLSAIQAGLGLLYVGKPRMALVISTVPLLLFLLARVTGIIFQPWGMGALLLVVLVFWFGIIVWSGVAAHRSGEVTLSRLQRWYVYLAFWVTVLVAAQVVVAHRAQWLGFETYRLPSASMADTLIQGDFIVDDSWAYRLKSPLRGEIIVCAYPSNTKVKYVRRVIGLPGETVEFKDGQVFINGLHLSEPYVMPEHNLRTINTSLKIQVPLVSFFVLGDNRDNSYDSRYQGPVYGKDVAGRVKSIWFSYGSEAGVRVDRIGTLVR